MPVEIRELIIRAVVKDGDSRATTSEPSQNREEIVQACVREVLRILEKARER